MNATKNQVLRAALQVFDTTGLNASTAAITEAAGLSNWTLFRCFPTKQALQHELFRRIDRDLYVAASEAPYTPVPVEERLRRYWRQAAEYALANPAAFRYWVHYRRSSIPSHSPALPQWLLPVAAWLEEATTAGAILRLPRPLVVAQFAGQWEVTLHYLLTQPPLTTAEPATAMLEHTFRSWWRGLDL